MNDMDMEGDLEETEKINVVPLADLTLVLLIILMVLSPMISQSMIQVAVPEVNRTAAAVAPQERERAKEPILIAVTSRGVALNNVEFETVPHLMRALAGELEQYPERPVVVSAEDAVLVRQVVEVLDGARQVGAREVSLVKNLGGEKG